MPRSRFLACSPGAAHFQGSDFLNKLLRAGHPTTPVTGFDLMAGHRGRPRNAGLAACILQAALHELAEKGYERMSIDEVARRAGTSKPTIYRRFRCKEDLATAAVHSLQQSTIPHPTGATYADLVAIIADLQHCMLRPNGMSLIGVVLVEENRTPELIRLFRERVVRSRREALEKVLLEGRNAGSVRADADTDAAINAMVGALYARYIAGGTFPKTFPRRVVDAVWPSLRAGQARPRP